MSGRAAWSTVQLAEFLEVFEELDHAEIERRAIDRVAHSLDADVVALVAGGYVLRSLGFPPDRVPVVDLLELAKVRRSVASVPGLADSFSMSASIGTGGTLLVLRASAPFDREEETLVRAMARALGIALGAAGSRAASLQLAAQLVERHELSSRLFRIQRSISHRAPLQDVLDGITQGAAELLDAAVVGLRVVALEPGVPPLASLVGYDDVTAADFARWPLDKGFIGRAFVENRLVVTAELASEPSLAPYPRSPALVASMAAPVHHNGEAVGVLNVARDVEGRPFTEPEQEILLGLAEHASLAVNDASAVHQLRRALASATLEARHDPLTSLPNRSSVLETLDVTLTSASTTAPVCVLFVDLDRFKMLNDLYGHAFGDEVLVKVATRLASVVRRSDFVARLAGDEFVVVAPGMTGSMAAELADRLARRLTEPLEVDGRRVSVTASIGLAEATSPSSGEQLLADADLAMYRAKQQGRAGIVRFDLAMRSELFRRTDLERELDAAIRNRQIVAHYQPCVDLATGEIRSFEALARWRHPDRGLLTPDHFVDVAEETGQITEIDRLVLEDACAHLAAWSELCPDLSLSANLSTRQFTSAAVVDVVRGVLASHALDPARVWLEITERAVMGSDNATTRLLDDIRDLGVRFMIDDFGTGYSSLVYLKRLPVDALKIDRAFVDGLGDDPENEAIVTAILRLADALGHHVVAEGVETYTQREWLLAMGCRRAQGYLFSAPVDATTMGDLLAARRPLATA